MFGPLEILEPQVGDHFNEKTASRRSCEGERPLALPTKA